MKTLTQTKNTNAGSFDLKHLISILNWENYIKVKSLMNSNSLLSEEIILAQTYVNEFERTQDYLSHKDYIVSNIVKYYITYDIRPGQSVLRYIENTETLSFHTEGDSQLIVDSIMNKPKFFFIKRGDNDMEKKIRTWITTYFEPIEREFYCNWENLPHAQLLDVFPKLSFNNTDKAVGDLINTLSKMLENAGLNISIVQRVISIFLKLFIVSKTNLSMSVLTATFIDIMITLGLNFVMVNNAVTFLSSFQFPKMPHAQMGGEILFTPGLQFFVSLLFTGFFMFLVGGVPDTNDLSKFLSKIGTMGRAITSVKALMESMQGWVKEIIDFISVKLFNKTPTDIANLEVFVSGLGNWYERVSEVLQLDVRAQVIHNQETCRKIERLYLDGLNYSRNLEKFKIDKKLALSFRMHFDSLSRLYSMVDKTGNLGSGPRSVPIIVQLFGDSGVGKSGVVNPLAIDILRQISLESAKNWASNIYMRNAEQEYWDGYKNQQVVIYDDFAQKKDSMANPNVELFEIIRSGNLMPYPLHMASIEEKAKTNFTSRAILLTTNVQKPGISSLACSDAVYRRIDLSVRVRNKPEFTKFFENKTMLDKNKIQMLLDTDFSLDVYLFDIVDISKGHDIMSNLTYDELKVIVEDLYNERFNSSERMHKFLNAYAQGYDDDVDLLMDWINAINAFDDEDIEKELNEWIDSDPSEYNFMSYAINEVVFQNGYVGDFESDNMLSGLNSRGCVLLETMAKNKSFLSISVAYIIGKRFLTRYYIPARKISKIPFVPTLNTWFRAVKKAVTSITWLDICSVVLHVLSIWAITKAMRYFIHKFLKLIGIRPFCTMYECEMKECEFNCPTCNYFKGVANTWIKYPFIKQCLEDDSKLKKPIKENVLDFINTHSNIDCLEFDNGKFCFFEITEQGIYAESSGDPRTKTMKPPTVESSGDPRTRTVKPPTVESSGDPRTQKYLYPKIEGDDLIHHNYAPVAESSGDPRTNKIKMAKIEMKDSILHIDDDNLNGTCSSMKNGIRAVAGKMPVVEAVIDNNSHDLINNKVLKNLYKLFTIDHNGERKMRMNIVFVQGRIALTANHIRHCIEDAAEVEICGVFIQEGYLIPANKIRIREVVNKKTNHFKDACLLEFPLPVHTHCTIVHQFITSKELTFKKIKTNLIGVRRIVNNDEEHFGQMIYSLLDTEGVNRELNYTYDVPSLGKEGILTIRDHYEYKAETYAGECGSVLVACAPSLARKLLGIHVCGQAGIGFSTSITADDLEYAISQFKSIPSAQMIFDFDKELVASGNWKPEGDFVPLGVISESYFGPARTDIRPSRIYNEVTAPITRPALLRRTSTLDPLGMGLKKAGVKPIYIDQNDIDDAVASYKVKILRNQSVEYKRVLTNMEAVEGVMGDDFLAPVNRRSSPGYKWSKMRKSGSLGKTQWLGSDDVYTLTPDVEEAMTLYEENAKKGIRTPTVFVDTLKDERRANEKVDIGKTRVFAAGPMDYILIMRKYFLGFAAHFMRNRITNEACVGINPFSDDWKVLFKHLTSLGVDVFAGDFSNFDGTLNSQILHACLGIINEFYDDGNEMIRETLFQEIMHSVHVTGDNVYMWTHSQPSGNPLTAILNSMYNSISLRICWIRIMRKYNPTFTIADFNDNVRVAVYGDDNVVAVSPRVAEFYDQRHVTQAYSEIGMVYTDEEKSGKIRDFRSIFDISFLKRKFRMDRYHDIKAPLDLKVVLEMCNWIRGDEDQEESTLENVKTAIEELSLHDEMTFDEFCPKLIKACHQKIGRIPEVYNYRYYQEMSILKRL